MELTVHRRTKIFRGGAIISFLRQVWRVKHLYLFVLPSLALVTIWCYIPIIQAMTLGFTAWRLPDATHRLGYRQFVGLANFQRALQDEKFWNSFLNLGKVLAVNLFSALVVSLLAAVILHHLRSQRARRAYQIGFVSPLAVPGAVLLLVWNFIYNPHAGALNRILVGLGFSSFQDFGWLGKPETALWAILFTGFPFIGVTQTLVYLGGLQNIPQDIYDSASLDGVTAWQRLVLVEIPLIASQIRLILLLTIIGSFTMYQSILIMMSGGQVSDVGGARVGWPPTLVPALHLFNNAFVFEKYEYATALGMILLLFILVTGWLTRRLIPGEG